MSRHRIGGRVRAVFLLLATLLFGALAAVVGSLIEAGSAYGAPGSIASTCSVSGTTSTITLGDGTSTLVDSGGYLYLTSTNNTTPTSCGAFSGISTVQFAVATGASPIKLVLDQTGGVFPCGLILQGPLNTGNSTTEVDVTGANGEGIAVGSSGVNVNGAACSAYSAGTLTDVGSYSITTSSTSGVALSAAGQYGTGGPVTQIPVTLDASASTAADTLVAGDSSETFKPGAPGSQLDFSLVTCPASSCSLAVNESGGSIGSGLPSNGKAALSYTGGTWTYDLSSSAANFTTVTGNSSIPTSLYAANGSSFVLDGNVTEQGCASNLTCAGNYSYLVTASGSGNQIAAGSGKETFTVTGSNVNFKAGPGSDNFYDTGTGNTLDFSGLSGSLNVDLTNGTASDGGSNYIFQRTNSSPPDPSPFVKITGASGGNTAFTAGSTYAGFTLVGQGSNNSADFSSATQGVVANLTGSTQTSNAMVAPAIALVNVQVGPGQVLVCATVDQSCTNNANQFDTLQSISSVIGSGPSVGYSTFYGGSSSTADYFTGQGNDNTFLGDSTAGDCAAACTYTITAGTGSANQVIPGAGIENFNITGSNLTVVGGAGTDTFDVTTGSGNTFEAGTGNNSFYDNGTGNTVDFSNVSSANPLSVDLTKGTATDGSVSYIFQRSSGSNDPSPFTLVKGASGGNTTFTAGAAVSGFTIDGQGSGNSIIFSSTTNGVVVNLSNANQLVNGITVPNGDALVCPTSGCVDILQNIYNVTGPTFGNSTFYGGGSGISYSFTAQGGHNVFQGDTNVNDCVSACTYALTFGSGTGNQVNAGAGTENITLSGNGLTATGGSGADTFTVTGSNDALQGGSGTSDFTVTGSSDTLQGGSGTGTFNVNGSNNTFQAGAGPDYFYDNGSNNTVDFSGVSTSSSNLLTVNLGSGTASAGGNQYTFSKTSSSTDLSPFTQIKGSTGGYTTFLAGDLGGFALVGQGTSGNQVDFSPTGNGIVVNLTTSNKTFSGLIAANQTLSGVTLTPGQVLVCATFNGRSCPSGTNQFDTITGMQTVTGPTFGYSTFFAGSTGGVALDGLGSNNSVFFTSPADGIVANLTANPVTSSDAIANGQTLSGVSIGPGEVLVCSSTASTCTGSTNQIDSLSGINTVTGPAFGYSTFYADQSGGFAIAGNGTNNSIVFTSPGNGVVVNLSGGNQTFSGPIAPGETLTGLNLTSGEVLVCAPYAGTTSNACPGSANQFDTVSGITSVTGPAFGYSTFYAGSTGGYTFFGGGTNNAISFSPTGNGIVVNLDGTNKSFTGPIAPGQSLSGIPVNVGQVLVCAQFGVNTCPNSTNQYDTLQNIYNVTGPAFGYSTFYGGSSANVDIFTGQGNGNSFFGDTNSGDCASTCSYYITAGSGTGSQVVAGADSQTFYITGSNLTVKGSGGTDVFDVTSGSGNTFQAGTGSNSFYDNGTNNTVDFSNVSASNPLTIDLTNGTAVDGSTNYIFQKSGGSNDPSPFTLIKGASGGNTTFKAGAVYAGLTLIGQGVNNSATFVPAGNGVVANLSGATQSFTGQIAPGQTINGQILQPGQVLVCAPFAGNSCTGGNPQVDTLQNIFTITGPSFGYSTFYGGPSTYVDSFTGQGSNNVFLGDSINGDCAATCSYNIASGTAGGNKIVAGLGIENFSITGSYLTVDGGTGTDTFTVTSGSSNTFVAGTGSNTFYDNGSNNTVDFSNVSASNPLTVNLTNGTAGDGTSSYAFQRPGVPGDPSPFSQVIGAVGGDTSFTAGPIGGFALTGQGTGNTVTFATPLNGVVVNLSGSGQSFSGQIAPGQMLSGVSVPNGTVLVCAAVGVITCGGPTYQYDTLNNLTTVIGSAVGFNTFYGGQGSSPYSFTGPGTNNTYRGDATAGDCPSNQACSYTITAGTGLYNQVFGGSGTENFAITGSNLTVTGGSGTGTFTVTGSDNIFKAGPGSANFYDNGSNNTVDLTSVSTTPSAHLYVDVNAGPLTEGSGINLNDGVASTGSATYNFQRAAGGFDSTPFTTIIGAASQGYTDFFAGGTPGVTLEGQGSSNSLSFATYTGPVIVNLSTVLTDGVPGGDVLLGTGTCPLNCDTLSGITTVTGSTNGGDTFVAAPGSSENFQSAGGSNAETLDLSNLTHPVVVNDSVSGQGPPGTPYGTATSGGYSYSFTNFAGSPTVFKGPLIGGATFYAGTVADTFTGSGTGNTLSFAYAPTSSLIVCEATYAASGCPAAGVAHLGTGTAVAFSGFQNYVGLPAGTSRFVADDTTTGLTFTAEPGGTTTADFSPAAHAVRIDLTTGTVFLATGTDTLNQINNVLGSALGGNYFVANPLAAETFGQSGAGTGDTIDFSAVASTNATSSGQLTINDTKTSTPAAVSYTANLGGITYSFQNGSAGFTYFIGASSGYTNFLASNTVGGTRFQANGSGNTASFATAPGGVTVNMKTGEVDLANLTGGPDYLCITSCASLANLYATITGSQNATSASPNVYLGDLTGTSFTSAGTYNTVSYINEATPVTVDLTSGTDTVSGAGTPDTFSFSFGTPTILGSASGGDTFRIGTAGAFIGGNGFSAGGDTLDLTKVPAPPTGSPGLDVNLNSGSISGSTIAGINFTPCAGGTNQLCVANITAAGTTYANTYTVAANQLALPPLSIVGGSANSILDLSQLTSSVTVQMPGASAGCVNPGVPCAITFTGIGKLIGTSAGGDHVFVGTGGENLVEGGTNPGTLDFTTSSSGVTVTVTGTGISSSGSATNTSSTFTASFSGFTTLIGTSKGDAFTQTGAGSFDFRDGGATSTVVNSLTLTGAGFSGSTVHLVPTTVAGCTAGSDGTVTNGSTVNDTFACLSQVGSSSSLTYLVDPGVNGTLNGGNNGTLELCTAVLCPGLPAADPLTSGVTIDLGQGTVTGDGGLYNFKFSGMSTVDGTSFSDLFVAAPGNFTLNGAGGSDGITFANLTSAETVNDSGNSYTIPGTSTTVQPFTATGASGTVGLNGIASITGTSSYNDTLIAGTGPATLFGGTGNVRFVLTGGNDYVYAGSGQNTLDLSLIQAPTQLNLGTTSLQALGTGAGYLSLLGGNFTTVYGSAGGSSIWGGNGSLSVYGGGGTNWLAGGVGNQLLVSTTGTGDTLVGGVGNDTLTGGQSAVTFVPGSGTDTLTSPISGNTLSYQGAPNPVLMDLSNSNYTVPASETGTGSSQGLTANTATGGWGTGSTAKLGGAGITNVIGTPQADYFYTASGDAIQGGGGNDLFLIAGSSNTLTAGNGTQSRFVFVAPGGNNVIYGGGASTLDYSQSSGAVTVNLQSGTATGGFGGTQTVYGILNVIGSALPDSCVSNGCPTNTFIAGGPGETITGLGGYTVMQAGPSGGDTFIYHGSALYFCAQASCAQAGTTSGGGNNTIYGGTGQNYFYTQNGIPDTIYEAPGSTDIVSDDQVDKVIVT